MQKRELYLEPIIINDFLKMVIDRHNQANLLLMQNEEVNEIFSVRKRIFSLFAKLENLTQSNITVKYRNYDLYASPIHLINDVYFKISEREIVEFYQTVNHEDKILYAAKLDNMVQTLFKQIKIALEIADNPNYLHGFPKIYQDMMEIVGLIKI